MKKVLVLGINGTFGKHVAKALESHGWTIKALVRDPKKLSHELKHLDVVKGDASNSNDVRNAANDVEIIVYGINPPKYNWEGKATQWLDITVKVAEEKKLGIIFPGNVYNFNPENSSDFSEDAEQSPVTKKGALRQQMEARLKLASARGVKVLIFRMGDFIAPGSVSSWLPHLIKTNGKKTTLQSPGPQNLKHTWAYVPDAAETIARLTEKWESLPNFNVFHFEGYRASISDIAKILSNNTLNSVKIKTFPWWMLKPLRPFSSSINGIFEMRYLWNTELNLSDNKIGKTLSSAQSYTPLEQALHESYYPA